MSFKDQLDDFYCWMDDQPSSGIQSRKMTAFDFGEINELNPYRTPPKMNQHGLLPPKTVDFKELSVNSDLKSLDIKSKKSLNSLFNEKKYSLSPDSYQWIYDNKFDSELAVESRQDLNKKADSPLKSKVAVYSEEKIDRIIEKIDTNISKFHEKRQNSKKIIPENLQNKIKCLLQTLNDNNPGKINSNGTDKDALAIINKFCFDNVLATEEEIEAILQIYQHIIEDSKRGRSASQEYIYGHPWLEAYSNPKSKKILKPPLYMGDLCSPQKSTRGHSRPDPCKEEGWDVSQGQKDEVADLGIPVKCVRKTNVIPAKTVESKKLKLIPKILLLGRKSCGKTSFINSLVFHKSDDETFFSGGFLMTSVRLPTRDKMRINLFEYSGRYFPHTKDASFFGEMNGFLVCCDDFSVEGFQDVKAWTDPKIIEGKPWALVITKADQFKESAENIIRERCGQFDFGDCFITSAKKRTNLVEVVANLVMKIIENF